MTHHLRSFGLSGKVKIEGVVQELFNVCGEVGVEALES